MKGKSIDELSCQPLAFSVLAAGLRISVFDTPDLTCCVLKGKDDGLPRLDAVRGLFPSNREWELQMASYVKCISNPGNL